MRVFTRAQRRPIAEPSATTRRSVIKKTHTSQLHPVAELQRVVGNQAVLRMMRAAEPSESRLKSRSTYRADPGVPLQGEVSRQSPNSAAPAGRLYDSRFKAAKDLISRQPAPPQPAPPQYETAGIPLTQGDMQDAAEGGYWGKKLQDAGFAHPIVDNLLYGEEANAVLAIAIQSLPRTRVTQEITKMVTIPPRPGVKGSRRIDCQILFRPSRMATQLGVVDIKLLPASATDLDTPANNLPGPSINQPFSPKTHPLMPHDFPPQIAQEWQDRGDVYSRVAYWIENTAGRKFDQLLKIVRRDETIPFRITGAKDPSSKVGTGDIYYLGPATSSQPPAGYNPHDFADKNIEDIRNISDPTHRDKLGTIRGLEKLSPEEQASIKVAIFQYFKSKPDAVDPKDPSKKKPKKGTRNSEVDAIVPILNPPPEMATKTNTNRSVLVTLRFQPNNDVDVEWIGELTEDTNDPKYKDRKDRDVQPFGVANKKISLTHGSLDRINGYLAHTQGATEADKVASLRAWLQTRYKKLTLPPAATTLAAIEKEINAQIRDGSGTVDWYSQYGITVLDSGKAEARLGKLDHTCLQGVKNFDQSELQILELVLEKMSDEVLARLKGVDIARQDIYFKGSLSTNTNKHCKDVSGFEEQPHVAGITRGDRSAPIITIFDAAWDNVESLFVGGRVVDAAGKPGKLDVESASAQTFAHELGHVVSYGPNVRKEFDKLVKEKNIKPMTWVAAEDPDPPKELFAEAFALYYSDPQWLHDNSPELYKFFDELDKKTFIKGNKASPQPTPGKH